jgi:hypothetical protein
MTLPPMTETAAQRPLPRTLVAAGGAIALLLAGAVLLWARYGTTIFFETIRAGFVACFG